MKYIATSKTFTGEIIIGYDEDQYLTSLEIKASLSDKQWQWFSTSFPVTLSRLKLLVETSALEITEVAPDLSFGVFWEAFKYKIGNKPRTEKLWNLLPESDRILALSVIPKYLYWLANGTIKQTYPETWLQQRRWENDYSLRNNR